MKETRFLLEFGLYLVVLALCVGVFVSINLSLARSNAEKVGDVLNTWFRQCLKPILAAAFPFVFAGISGNFVPGSIWESQQSGSGILFGLLIVVPLFILANASLAVIALARGLRLPNKPLEPTR